MGTDAWLSWLSDLGLNPTQPVACRESLDTLPILISHVWFCIPCLLAGYRNLKGCSHHKIFSSLSPIPKFQTRTLMSLSFPRLKNFTTSTAPPCQLRQVSHLHLLGCWHSLFCDPISYSLGLFSYFTVFLEGISSKGQRQTQVRSFMIKQQSCLTTFRIGTGVADMKITSEIVIFAFISCYLGFVSTNHTCVIHLPLVNWIIIK